MSKTLCEWKKKEIEKQQDKLKSLIIPVHFICRKCARVANKKDALCKPAKL